MIKKAIIIDGHSLIYRAYYATVKQLDFYNKHQLFPTNAIRTFIIMLHKLLTQQTYTYGLIAFDTSRVSFRTQLLTDYKINRPSMPEALSQQIPILIQILKLWGWKTYSLENYEADDLIGSFAHLCQSHGIESHVFSSDNDLLQLVSPMINVHIIKKGTHDIISHNQQNFSELNHGLSPEQIVDLKAMMGDKSDNYKGIDGLGFKTSLQLLKNYSSLSQIYANIQQITPLKLQQKLLTGQKDVEKFFKIAKIVCNVPLNCSLNDFCFQSINHQKLNEILKQFQLLKLEKYFQ